MEEQKPIQSLTDQEKLNHALFREIQDLKEKVIAIENNKVIESLQLPIDVLESVGIIQEPHRLKRGNGSRPLLESEIKEAQAHCNTAADCARYLKVGTMTYRKHAERYGIYKTNQWGKGSRKKIWDPEKGMYPLNKILDGLYPDYPIYRLKDLIIRSKKKEAKCEMCGFEDRRITDKKMPLLINFEDGNSKNHKLENIKIYCYNCTSMYGKGYIRRGKTEFHFLDPDRMQDAKEKIDARF